MWSYKHLQKNIYSRPGTCVVIYSWYCEQFSSYVENATGFEN